MIIPSFLAHLGCRNLFLRWQCVQLLLVDADQTPDVRLWVLVSRAVPVGEGVVVVVVVAMVVVFVSVQFS